MIDKNIRYIDINCGGKTPLDYLEEISKLEKLIHVSLVVFSSGEKNMLRFINIATKANKTTIYYSGYLQRMQKPTFNLINRLDVYEIRKIESHMKLILIKTENSNYIINSSSNLDSNSKIEMTEITNSIDEYNFWIYFLNSNSK